MTMIIHKEKVELKRKEMVIWDGCQHVKKLQNNRPARCAGQLTQDVLGRCKKRYQFLFMIQKDNYILHILRFLGIISSA